MVKEESPVEMKDESKEENGQGCADQCRRERGKVESKTVNGVMARPITCLAVAQNGDGQGLERSIVEKLATPL